MKIVRSELNRIKNGEFVECNNPLKHTGYQKKNIKFKISG